MHEIETLVDRLSEESLAKTEITKFRVETETGLRTIKFKLLQSDEIESVYAIVKPYAESEEPFYIKANFPDRKYDIDDTRTIKEHRLTVACRLYMCTVGKEQTKVY